MFFAGGSPGSLGNRSDAQNAAHLGRGRDAVLDGRAGTFPAIDHAGRDGGPLELADVGRGQDGAGEFVGLGEQELGKYGAAEVAGAAACVAAARQPGMVHRQAEEIGGRRRFGRAVAERRTRRWPTTARRPLRTT